MNRLINSLINHTWGKLNGLWKGIVTVGVALLLILLLISYGARLKNWLGGQIYHWHVSEAQSEIQGYRQQAEAAKQVAEQALAELAAEKKITALEKQRRELAENILAEKHLSTEQKLKDYAAALAKLPDASPVGTTDELCQRARLLGISCQ